ncbi:glycoprotein suaprga1 [Ophiocordyceps camponoti-floridani]|uniref:Glycoprotein suaprga1 n=1 Tax=Ophiocordyceps camponoti-floridani TaxID=2030778 RepID=A0A8H4Q5C7_9HYPO|nr:glycoprotein suaprga1 [Ophiocordyceps camponoti-floridani]
MTRSPLCWVSLVISPRSHCQPAVEKADSGEDVDSELVGKLVSELQIEEELKEEGQTPASIDDFLGNSPFKISDEAGHEVVKLIRSYNDEKITVSFSISDLDANFNPYGNESNPDEAADPAMDDVDPQPRKQANTTTRAQTPAEEEEEEEEVLESDEMSDEAAPPINLSIVIEKPRKTGGALNISASARDGAIEVDAVSYVHDAALVTSNTPDSVHKRVDLYSGPPFGSLDENLQVLMERFLEERGVNQALAVFVADYVDVKEQNEYMSWLNNIKGFVEA